ncbi:MAG: hypothetical protein M0R73_10535 [Dehalococcoidia bacterium]|nr:hypothetical protein [Dehalococcoidia bacterium]
MSDLDDRRLDALLRETASRVAYPEPRNMRARVLAAVADDARPVRTASGLAWRPALAAAVLAAVVVLATLLALPGTRTAVGEFFGIVPGQRIELVTATPTPTAAASPGATGTLSPSVSPTPSSSPTFSLSGVATVVTVEQAEALLPYPLAIPEGAGEPQEVWAIQWGGQALIVMSFADLDLWQTRGGGYFGKSLPEDVALEQLLVNGRPAWWVGRVDHLTSFHDAGGNEVLGSRRTVDRNALIWQGEATYYRIETELPLDQALAIAESLP